jgi:transposase
VAQEDNPVVAIRDAIGVDLGLKNFAITSEGSKYDLYQIRVKNPLYAVLTEGHQ